MKKIFLATLIALVLTSFSYAGIVITTNITIGRKSQNCSGFGICSASTGNSNKMGSITGTVEINEDKGSVLLGISENDILQIQPEKISYFKGKGNVVFTEDFTFPSELNKAAKMTKLIVIKKGEYPLTHKNGVYYIEIPY